MSANEQLKTKEHDEAEDLRRTLLKQIEYYFSRSNLAQDSYLVSQMNTQHYVPIQVVAGFKMVKRLTSDINLIIDVMKASPNLQVNDENTMVKPNIRLERTTLILRDIPEDAQQDEILALFDNPGCSKPVSLRSDIQGCWYVNFESEDDCTKTAMEFLKLSFRGKSIRCRVKSESLLRSVYHGGQFMQQPVPWIPPPVQSYPGIPIGYFPSTAPFWGNPVQFPGPGAAPEYHVDRRSKQQQQSIPQQPPPRPNHQHQQNISDSQASSRKNRRSQPSQSQPSAVNSANTSSRRNNKKKKQGGSNKPVKNVHLSLEHFPALPSSSKSSVVGYQRSFIKYSREELSKIVSSIPPEVSFPLDHSQSVVRAEPISESQLLKPFPVMFPASPSPLVAAKRAEQQKHHLKAMPELTLDPKPSQWRAVTTTTEPPVSQSRPAAHVEKPSKNTAKSSYAAMARRAARNSAPAAREAAAAAVDLAFQNANLQSR